MKRKIYPIILFVAYLMITAISNYPTEALASTVTALSDEQLVAMSDDIIHLTIIKTEGIQFNETTILTKITAVVQESYKNSNIPAGSEYVFYSRGGNYEDFSQTVTGEFMPKEGMEVVVFLEKIKRYGDVPMVLGMAQGAFIADNALKMRSTSQPPQRLYRKTADLNILGKQTESEFAKCSETACLKKAILAHLMGKTHE